jgi:hypothetical protein
MSQWRHMCGGCGGGEFPIDRTTVIDRPDEAAAAAEDPACLMK